MTQTSVLWRHVTDQLSASGSDGLCSRLLGGGLLRLCRRTVLTRRGCLLRLLAVAAVSVAAVAAIPLALAVPILPASLLVPTLLRTQRSSSLVSRSRSRSRADA